MLFYIGRISKFKLFITSKLVTWLPLEVIEGMNKIVGFSKKVCMLFFFFALHTLHFNKLVKCKLNDIVLRNWIKLFFQFHPTTENCKKK